MAAEPDVILVGTGVAPLFAALHLINLGKQVRVLNPDPDFFLENSELPLYPSSFRMSDEELRETLTDGQIDPAIESLRPDFPGPVEMELPPFSGSAAKSNVPKIRQRARVWVAGEELETALDEIYLVAAEVGGKPLVLDGGPALAKFPGASAKVRAPDNSSRFKGVVVSKAYDVDVPQYRFGLLEYVREKLGEAACQSGISFLEILDSGLRFRANGRMESLVPREGVLIFWTPKLSSWIERTARQLETKLVLPLGVSLYEAWKIISRAPLDPGTIGIFGNFDAWADVRTSGETDHLLNVLRAGPRVALDQISWAKGDSFQDLADFCGDFLKWDRFSVRSFHGSPVLNWPDRELGQKLKSHRFKISVVHHADGPLAKVVSSSKKACQRFMEGS